MPCTNRWSALGVPIAEARPATFGAEPEASTGATAEAIRGSNRAKHAVEDRDDLHFVGGIELN